MLPSCSELDERGREETEGELKLKKLKEDKRVKERQDFVKKQILKLQAELEVE